MINLDLTKVLPENPHNYLAPILPGAFFAVSVLIANPELVSRLTMKPQQSLAIGHYGMIGIALFLVFAIGNGFILLVTLIEYILNRIYTFLRFLWRELCRGPIQRFSVWICNKFNKPGWRQRWSFKFHRHVQQVVFGFDEMRDISACWRMFASRLLQTRYGIDLMDLHQGEWNVLYWTLQTPNAKEKRAGRSTMMIASHATGWAGLVATKFAPALHSRYYFGYCLIMILSGLLHHYYVDAFINDPRSLGYVNVRALLREFWRPTKETPSTPNAGPESGESAL